MADSSNPVTTVVVTTRNEREDIERCLLSLKLQTYPAIEIVVVDNQSTDGTDEIARKYADVFLNAGPERSAQRNAGARQATGDYLFFIDADMELEQKVIEQAVHAARTGADAVVVPECSVGDGLWTAAKALERSCYEGDETIEAARFFRRDSFEKHGGYDESLTGPEDWDLPARIARTDVIARTTARIVHHEGHLTLQSLARKKFYYGRSFARYIQRHPQLARKQLVVFRPAFVRHRRRLANDPTLASAMLFMKLVEFSAGGAGVVVGWIGDRRRA